MYLKGLLLSALLLGGLFAYFKSEGEGAQLRGRSIRTAFPRRESPLIYDPANIQFAYEYIYLETIYSPLVEYNSKGDIVPGVAERFWWDKNSLHLKIRDDLKTIEGKRIDAEDVLFSLKRVMILGGNTHGNLIDLLCGKDLKSIDQDCPGLRREGNVVTLSPQVQTPFLIPMLTGIDFAVIPRGSVDLKTLKIVEMKNTSGPMYLEGVSEAGEVKLRTNPSHFNYTPTQPEIMTLVPSVDPHSQKSQSLELFEQNKVDLITTIDTASAESVLDYHLANEATTTLHSSLDIRVFLIRFSKRGIKNFSAAERFKLGPALVASLRQAFKEKKSLKPTDQILPAYGEGGLPPELIQKVKEKQSASSGDIKSEQPIKVYLMRLPDLELFKEAIRAVLPRAEFVDSNESILPNWGDNDADIMLSGPDMGFVEDISLYSYAVKSGILRSPIDEDEWLATYMKVADKEERILRIQKLHAYNLDNGFAFPCFASPYVALARKPWRITLPKLFANHPLWQIRLEP